jgi:hypothetical protein
MCDTEVYTVRVDSTRTSTSNTNFVSYINIPLKNVVKAELLMAVLPFNVNASAIIYIHVKELVSKFNDRATLEYTLSSAGQVSTQGGVSTPISNIQYLNTSFATIPGDQQYARTVYTASGSGYPTDVNFIEPIRQLEKLSIAMYDFNGNLIVDPTEAGPTFLVFRFTCAKPNVCQYGGQIV